MNHTVEKILSANDTGETGTHQAGLHIPKDRPMLSFFPKLDSGCKNPRCAIDVRDAVGEDWTFNFIYYNNKFFGGTRNEYRLTGMTKFIRRYSLKVGDVVIFNKLSNHLYGIDYRRKEQQETRGLDGRKVLKLSGNWMVFDTNQIV